MSIELIVEKLKSEGGCIVSSADCSEMEIADARCRGDFYVDEDGFGFVRRLPGWLVKHSRFARNAEPDNCESDSYDANIAMMVDRFLGWKLPADFHPDCGIDFHQTYQGMEGEKPREYGSTWWPIGTNLFTADQAKAMIKHMLGETD